MVDLPHLSATPRHKSPSPPTTSTVFCFKGVASSSDVADSTSSAKGVWLCTNMLVSSGTLSSWLRSATRDDSRLPPPLVRRMKGISWVWRYERVFWAWGRAVEERRRTPSMLRKVSPSKHIRLLGVNDRTYSNANAKGAGLLWVVVEVWRERWYWRRGQWRAIWTSLGG